MRDVGCGMRDCGVRVWDEGLWGCGVRDVGCGCGVRGCGVRVWG